MRGWQRAASICSAAGLSQPPDGLSSACRCATLQGYCVVPAEKRFLLLFTFLKKNANNKARHCCSACCC